MTAKRSARSGRRTGAERANSRRPPVGLTQQIKSALRALNRLPVLNFADPGYSRTERSELWKSLVRELTPLVQLLDGAILNEMPELQLPQALACTCWQPGIAPPLARLLRCPDLCPACVSEARLVLECVCDPKKRGGARRGVFAPQMLAARIHDHADRQRRDADARRSAPRLVSWPEDGAMHTIAVQGEPVRLSSLTPVQQHILKVLRREFPDRLTTRQLADVTGRKVGALGGDLVLLAQLQLIHNQKRKGYLITTQGMDTLAQASRRKLSISKR